MVELALNGRQVIKDIRMIVLKIVNNQRAGVVVNKFGAFIKESGVVFVSFNNKKRRAAKPGRNTKILWDTANQKAGGHTRVVQYPGKHAAGAGLAVGAGSRQHPAFRSNMAGEKFRAGNVRQPLVEHILNRRVPPCHGITDNHQVRRRVKRCRIIPLKQRNSLLFKLRAHRWVDIFITAGHLKSQLSGQNGQASHKRSANSQNVYVHPNFP